MQARPTRRLLSSLVFLPQALVTVAALVVVWRWRPALVPAHGTPVFAAGLGTLSLAFVVILRGLRRARTTPLSRGRVLGLQLAHFCTTWIGSVALFPFFTLPYLLALAALLGALGAAVSVRLGSSPLRRIEIVFMTLVSTLVLAELGLEVWVRVRPTPFLVGANLAVREFLEVRRGEPGRFYFGTPYNSLGDHEEEPRPLGPGERRIVSIGDSFSVGVVPLSMHYTSVCERELANVDVYNMGAGGIGLSEYLWLLANDALRLEPDAIVVNVFVGNDLDDLSFDRGNLNLTSRLFDRDSILFVRFVVRTLRLSSEKRRSRQEGAMAGRLGDGGTRRIEDHGELLAEYPWLGDPLTELPTYSEEGYLTLETRKAQRLFSEDARFPNVVDLCERMATVAGDVPVLFTLIPDEPQVEDALWAVIEERLAGAVSRNRPQDVLLEQMRARGLRVLDYLPVLRDVEPLEDGNRHVYRLRDTHWNPRGNEVAGVELARFLREELDL